MTIERSPEALDALKRLVWLREMRARQLRLEDPTPGHLAKRLDPAIVQTPALDIIDSHLIAVRDAIDVMYLRQARRLELIDSGMNQQEAAERAAAEIEDGGVDRLIISMPPQEGKSQRVTRYGVLWLLRQFPALRIGLVSYDGGNANTFSYQIRSDIERFDGVAEIDIGLRLVKNQKAMGRWLLQTGGGVYAIGIGGGLTGRPVDLLLIDDPVKDFRDADSLLLSEQAWEWWQTVARPRLAPWAPVIEVATRWHESDLAGRMIARQVEEEAAGTANYDKWTVVNIPAKAEHDSSAGEVDILGRQPGEYMVSARGRTQAVWEATEAATAARFWSALYQGRPTPQDGDIWLKSWWRFYDEAILVEHDDGTFKCPGWDVSLSWDCAFRDTKSSDFVVGQVWAKKGTESRLIYQVHKRLSFTATVDNVRRMAMMFPQARRKIIEGKANGDAVIDSLKKEIPGIIVANPTQSKAARATAVSPFIRAGNVQLPASRIVQQFPQLWWDVDEFVNECTAFPNGAHDDQVDAASQYLAEAYLIGGEATMTVPNRQMPRSRQTSVQRRLGPQIGNVQQSLTNRARGR